MPKRSNTHAPDFAQIAKRVVDQATGLAPKPAPVPDTRNPAAVALGKLGGKKGGPARAASLSAKRRSDIAKKAARSRWKGHKKGK